MPAVDNPTIAHLHEMLAAWGRVDARRMFGGWGLYRGPLMFGLLADDVPYFKCGDALREVAPPHELKFFEYEKKDEKGKTKKVVMNYAAVPGALMDDAEGLAKWAEAAYQDALAARRGKPKYPQATERAIKRKGGR
jgi:DNA transformation protein